jgi:hypothetical protein
MARADMIEGPLRTREPAPSGVPSREPADAAIKTLAMGLRVVSAHSPKPNITSAAVTSGLSQLCRRSGSSGLQAGRQAVGAPSQAQDNG